MRAATALLAALAASAWSQPISSSPSLTPTPSCAPGWTLYTDAAVSEGGATCLQWSTPQPKPAESTWNLATSKTLCAAMGSVVSKRAHLLSIASSNSFNKPGLLKFALENDPSAPLCTRSFVLGKPYDTCPQYWTTATRGSRGVQNGISNAASLFWQWTDVFTQRYNLFSPTCYPDASVARPKLSPSDPLPCSLWGFEDKRDKLEGGDGDGSVSDPYSVSEELLVAHPSFCFDYPARSPEVAACRYGAVAVVYNGMKDRPAHERRRFICEYEMDGDGDGVPDFADFCKSTPPNPNPNFEIKAGFRDPQYVDKNGCRVIDWDADKDSICISKWDLRDRPENANSGMLYSPQDPNPQHCKHTKMPDGSVVFAVDNCPLVPNRGQVNGTVSAACTVADGIEGDCHPACQTGCLIVGKSTFQIGDIRACTTVVHDPNERNHGQRNDDFRCVAPHYLPTTKKLGCRINKANPPA